MLNKKTVAIVLLLCTGFLSFLILKPFLLAIVSAAIFAILFHPMYSILLKSTKLPSVSALITCVLAFIIVLIPILLVGQALTVEATAIVREMATQNVSSASVAGFFQSVIDSIATVVPIVHSIDFKGLAVTLFNATSSWVQSQVFALPTKIAVVLFAIVLFYFLLKDGKLLVTWIYSGLPLSTKEQGVIDDQLTKVTYAVVYGQIVTAIAQGLVAMLGYWYFGLDAPVIWGLLTMFFSLVPFFGTSIVWVPASVYLFFSGIATSTTGWWHGLGLFIYGVIVITTVDNFMRPLLIGATTRMHPAIALLGVVGGITVFGFIGIFAGPLVLSLFVTLYDILIRKAHKKKDSIYVKLKL